MYTSLCRFVPSSPPNTTALVAPILVKVKKLRGGGFVPVVGFGDHVTEEPEHIPCTSKKQEGGNTKYTVDG